MQDSSSAAPLNRGEEPPVTEGIQAQGRKRGRARRSFLTALKGLALVLVFGAGAVGGLYAGGGLFPLLDRAIPWVEEIPAVGPGLSSWLQRIPGPASSSQRRLLELEEKEAFLDAKEKAIEEKQRSLKEQKKTQEAQPTGAEPEKTQRPQAPPETPAEETSRAALLESTLSEMAPSKAARILALMDVSEIGPVLERMDPDWRAQVLGKMPPREAARFLRYLKGDRPSSIDVIGSREKGGVSP